MVLSGEIDEESDGSISDGEIGGKVVSHGSYELKDNLDKPSSGPVPLFKRRAQSNPNLTNLHSRPNGADNYKPPQNPYRQSQPRGPPVQPPNMYRTNTVLYGSQTYHYQNYRLPPPQNYRGGYR